MLVLDPESKFPKGYSKRLDRRQKFWRKKDSLVLLYRSTFLLLPLRFLFCLFFYFCCLLVGCDSVGCCWFDLWWCFCDWFCWFTMFLWWWWFYGDCVMVMMFGVILCCCLLLQTLGFLVCWGRGFCSSILFSCSDFWSVIKAEIRVLKTHWINILPGQIHCLLYVVLRKVKRPACYCTVAWEKCCRRGAWSDGPCLFRFFFIIIIIKNFKTKIKIKIEKEW